MLAIFFIRTNLDIFVNFRRSLDSIDEGCCFGISLLLEEKKLLDDSGVVQLMEEVVTSEIMRSLGFLRERNF
jgi:hypothetical protein